MDPTHRCLPPNNLPNQLVECLHLKTSRSRSKAMGVPDSRNRPVDTKISLGEGATRKRQNTGPSRGNHSNHNNKGVTTNSREDSVSRRADLDGECELEVSPDANS
jgi:hypothetical protein